MAANTSEKNDNGAVTEHRIEAAEGLVRSTIVDQASDIEHGWREGYQNIIDNPDADEGRIESTPEYTLIADNGSGVELTEERGVNLITNMGESSKDAADHGTIGEFGVGGGQINAKGQAMWISGTQALLFDIKGWGLTVKQVSVADAADVVREYDPAWSAVIEDQFGGINKYEGLAILVNHYEDEVPDEDSYKWNKYEERVKDRFKYLQSVRDTELYYNGELISDTDPLTDDAIVTGNTTYTETFHEEGVDDVHIAVKHNSSESLKVYSGGIYVKDIDNRGLAGAVVTEKNLRLNFARNEIKSGCPIWDVVSDRLDEIRGDLFSQVKRGRLNGSAREFIATEIFDKGRVDEYGDIAIFKTTDEDVVSLNEIKDRDSIGIAPTSSKAADALTEAYNETVLAEHDTPVEKFVEARDEENEFSDLPSDFDATERAVEQGLHVDYEDVPESELTPSQMNRLGVARIIADVAGIGLEISYGKSDAARAWTDGRNFIKITDGVDNGGRWTQWVPMLWLILMHETAHKWGDKEDASHGRRFNRRFRKTVDENEDGLAFVMGLIEEHGLRRVAEVGNDESRNADELFE